VGLIKSESGRRGESTNGTGRDEDEDECGMHARSRGRGRARENRHSIEVGRGESAECSMCPRDGRLR
jgi:hypothetical protein